MKRAIKEVSEKLVAWSRTKPMLFKVIKRQVWTASYSVGCSIVFL